MTTPKNSLTKQTSWVETYNPNQKTMFKHKLGALAKDKITGFTGIITARVEFFTGCNRYNLQPVGLIDGKPIEGIYFDEAQIEISGSGIDAKEVKDDDNPGACAPNPSK